MIRTNYHGGDFEGNACRLLLRPEQLRVLEEMLLKQTAAAEAAGRKRSGQEPRVDVPRHQLLLLFDVLSAFGEVVT